MPQPSVRVVGSGYTSFLVNGTPLAWLHQVQDGGQRPVGQPYEAITPLGDKRPREFVTQGVIAEGTIKMMIRETWNAEVWWQLSGLAGTSNIQEIFTRLAEMATPMTATKIITPPGSSTRRGYTYHTLTVIGVNDGETVDVSALSTLKSIDAIYSHKTPL